MRRKFRRLTDEDVEQIKALLTTQSQRDVADQFGVSRDTIGRIALGTYRVFHYAPGSCSSMPRTDFANVRREAREARERMLAAQRQQQNRQMP